MALAQSHEAAFDFLAAEQLYRQLLADHPGFLPALQSWGVLAFRAGNLPFAAELFQRAIALDAMAGVNYRSYGEIMRRMGYASEAVAAGRQACLLLPGDADAYFNLALALADARDRAGAEAAYRKVLKLQEPFITQGMADADLWNRRGVTWQRVQQYDEAHAAFARTLELNPGHVVAWNCLGSLLRETGKIDEALPHFAKALEIDPSYAEARMNLAMAQLQLGDWKQGWEHYEARWTGSAESGIGIFARPACPLPQWNGSGDTAAQSILVYCEQGYGDTFQFVRFLELLCTRFAQVALVCPAPPLQLLLAASLSERVLLLKQMPSDFSAWDWHCPLLSLPRALGITLANLPAATPYLHAAPPAAAYWQARLERAAPGLPRVGLAWQGNPTHRNDWRRSIAFEHLAPLWDMPGVAWVSLQKHDAAMPRPAAPESLDTWLDWSDDLHDFADTAALAANLDLVISIDSAVAHLAGALGKPVWLLNRYEGEWRWLEGRENSPWYSGMRLFRQHRMDDWDGALQAVKAALSAQLPPSPPRR